MDETTNNTRYEILLERAVRAIEKQNTVSDGLLKVAGKLEENTRKLNDTFVLHAQSDKQIQSDVAAIKQQLLKWLKWLGISLVALIGGVTILRGFGIDLIQFIK